MGKDGKMVIMLSATLTSAASSARGNPEADGSSWAVGWEALTAIGTILLAVVTAVTVVYALRESKDARSDARVAWHRQNALSDRVALVESLRRAGDAYAEFSTSALLDARRRAFAQWLVSVRSAQGAGGYPALRENEHELTVMGHFVRSKDDDSSVISYRQVQTVAEELGSAIAEVNAMTWQMYSVQRGLLTAEEAGIEVKAAKGSVAPPGTASDSSTS